MKRRRSLHMKVPLIVTSMLVAAAPLFAEPLSFESTDTPTALVELYTSEGCSSCPPADAWMTRLKTSPDLWKRFVPVAFHVDYWNGLGWPDRFASRANSDRQRRYAAAWHTNSVYTPGLVLNGGEWRDWANSDALSAPVSNKVGRLQVTLRDVSHADVTFTPAGSSAKPQQVEVALLGGNIDSDVKRGENSGHKLRHDFVVLQLASAALTPDGKSFTASLALPAKTSDAPIALAAWVSGGEGQPPIQAVGGWLKKL